MKIELTPIGIMHSDQVEPYQASIQPDENCESGWIELFPQQNFEQALKNIEGCSHLWIIYVFHHNSNWKPMVQTPRGLHKQGVFSTRSPYRPNPIGLSVVELKSVDGLILKLGPNDLLDQSPILDIKPYHPEFDVISEAQIQWLTTDKAPEMTIRFSPVFESHLNQLQKINSKTAEQIEHFIKRQLKYDPTNAQKKRVQKKDHDIWTLSYRTWRVDFYLSETTVSVLDLYSGYSEEDLKMIESDKYGDKPLHLLFKMR